MKSSIFLKIPELRFNYDIPVDKYLIQEWNIKDTPG